MMLTDADLLNARLLIVDDQLAHVKLLERVLRDAGYVNVDTTIDPLQVCMLHRENPYDLILLDLQMPELDGFGVMEALKADTGAAVLPVIALTAQPGHKLRALQAGARDFINKPFDMVEVRIRIRHLLEVGLLYKKLAAHSQELERTVELRTAQLRESEARYHSLVDLASDWYWEQDDVGTVTRVSGPMMEMMGLPDPALTGEAAADSGDTWDAAERAALHDNIAARRPFLDFILNRRGADGSRRQFRVSGEPTFDSTCHFTGYRGVGVEILSARS